MAEPNLYVGGIPADYVADAVLFLNQYDTQVTNKNKYTGVCLDRTFLIDAMFRLGSYVYHNENTCSNFDSFINYMKATVKLMNDVIQFKDKLHHNILPNRSLNKQYQLDIHNINCLFNILEELKTRYAIFLNAIKV